VAEWRYWETVDEYEMERLGNKRDYFDAVARKSVGCSGIAGAETRFPFYCVD
jgi:hypothetical protein